MYVIEVRVSYDLDERGPYYKARRVEDNGRFIVTSFYPDLNSLGEHLREVAKIYSGNGSKSELKEDPISPLPPKEFKTLELIVRAARNGKHSPSHTTESITP